ncbi:hypothetical protein ACWGB8_21295 [Kitasatospora sp. NPDC054939]
MRTIRRTAGLAACAALVLTLAACSGGSKPAARASSAKAAGSGTGSPAASTGAPSPAAAPTAAGGSTGSAGSAGPSGSGKPTATAAGRPSRTPGQEDPAGLDDCSTGDLTFRIAPGQTPDRLVVTATRKPGPACVLVPFPSLSSDGLDGEIAQKQPPSPMPRLVLDPGEEAHSVFRHRAAAPGAPTYPFGTLHLTFLHGAQGPSDPAVELRAPAGSVTDKSAYVTVWASKASVVQY